MIELERNTNQDETEIWADTDFSHVIVQETEETARIDGPGPGWYVRDEDCEWGPFRTIDQALHLANDIDVWGEVTLAPANRLRDDIENGRTHAIADYLLEYLATYGTAGIDAQALARRVFERIEES